MGNVDIADDANSNETIEIIGDEVNDSVIDLTNDTNVVSNSPVRVGGNWANTPLHLARLPPNPRTPLHPPVMVDLTNSPVNHLDKTFPPQDVDTLLPGEPVPAVPRVSGQSEKYQEDREG